MKKKLYLAVLLLSLVATGVLLWGRMSVEQAAKSVEILADYEEFALMAEQMDMPKEDLFAKLAEAGINGVAVKEETLYNMVAEEKPIAYGLFKNITQDLEWKDLYGPEASAYLEEHAGPYDVVVRTYDQALFERLEQNITARYDAPFYQFFDESVNTIVLKGSIDDIYYTEDARYKDYLSKGVKLPRVEISSALEDIGMGFDPEKIEQVQAAGLSVNLRPANYYRYNSHIVEAYFDDLERYGEIPSTLIFSGREILSYNRDTNNYSQALYDEMKAYDIPVGMIESTVQRGFTEQEKIDTLAEDLEYNVVRVFPVIEYIQERYNYLGYYQGGKEIENTIYRAVTERNIRSVYLRPFKDSKFTYYEDLGDYKLMMDGLAERLAAHGITFGTSSVMPYNHVSVLMVMLSSYGLLVLGLILLKLIFDIDERFEKVLFVIGILGLSAINFVAPNLSVILLSFSAANIFPTVAIVFMIEFIRDTLLSKKVFALKDILWRSTVGLIGVVIIALIGGLYVAAMLSHPAYLVEMSYYRGVKASLLLPMAFFVIIYLLKLGYRRKVDDLEENAFFIQDAKRFFSEDVKIYYVLIAAIAGVIGYIYLARSGNESSIEALNVELIFRNFLEEVLIARPRTKEILMAFPALSAAFYFAARGYKQFIFPFAFTAVIGITSVVNTFCHSRTPVYLSVSRTLLSLGFSVVIGFVVILILEWIHRFYVANFGSKNA
jgi:hypothetical protein